MDLPTLELSGTPFEMGLQHGETFRDTLRDYAAERVQLAGSATWAGRSLARQRVLELADACLEEHRAYAPELAEELEGMARASDLSPAELVVVGGFTDFVDTVHRAAQGQPSAPAPGARGGAPGQALQVDTAALDDCTAFLVPGARAAGGRAMLAQTWDMHEGSAEHLVLLRGRPRGAPAFLAYTTAGCVGMIGMNEAGVCVGINNLTDAAGRPGVTWPFVVRRMLSQETLEGALAELDRARLAAGHNFLVMDANGSGANVEAMATASHLRALEDEPIAHTNHCLVPETIAVQRPRTPASQADSEARLERARALLARPSISPEDAMDILSDTQAICHAGTAPQFVGTCGAVVMVPSEQSFFAVKGRPSQRPAGRPFERYAVA